jgi:hypothetical protein
VIGDEFYFKVEGNWRSYYESEDHSKTENVKGPEKVLLSLAVSEFCVSEPAFFKFSFAVNKNLNLSK